MTCWSATKTEVKHRRRMMQNKIRIRLCRECRKIYKIIWMIQNLRGANRAYSKAKWLLKGTNRALKIYASSQIPKIFYAALAWTGNFCFGISDNRVLLSLDWRRSINLISILSIGVPWTKITLQLAPMIPMSNWSISGKSAAAKMIALPKACRAKIRAQL